MLGPYIGCAGQKEIECKAAIRFGLKMGRMEQTVLPAQRFPVTIPLIRTRNIGIPQADRRPGHRLTILCQNAAGQFYTLAALLTSGNSFIDSDGTVIFIQFRQAQAFRPDVVVRIRQNQPGK